jgi:hypothetical protein
MGLNLVTVVAILNLHHACEKIVRFQVLTVASKKMVVFWVVALCNQVEVY